MRPCETIIRENSDIWAKCIEVKKLTLLLYPKKEHKNIVIIGFIKMTRTTRIINGVIILAMLSNINSIPKETKNIVAKKSLNDLTFPIMAKLYGRLAKLNPDKKAPIAFENTR